MIFTRNSLIFSVGLWLALCASPAAAKNNEAVTAILSAILKSDTIETGSASTNRQIERVKKFYATRNNKPIWTRDDGPKGKAKALVAELNSSLVHGLSRKFYNLAKIKTLMASKDPDDLAQLELLLSGALVEFGGDLKNGRLGPQQKGSMNSIKSVDLLADDYIREAEATGNLRGFMGGLLQSDKRYVRLIAKLVEFFSIEKSGLWPKIPADGAEIPAGHSDDRMVKIRKLLVINGDLPISAMERGKTHDETTIKAVKHFQRRHGLDQSGDIDAATLTEMGVSVSERINQIKINLERRRWQIHAVDNDHFYVNLASGSVRLVRDGKVIGRFTLLNNDQMQNIPTFLGNMDAVNRVDEGSFKPEISLQSTIVENVSSEDVNVLFAIDNTQSLFKLLAGFEKPAGGSSSAEKLTFSKPIPIFMTYVTAWATRDGQIHFRRDIFKRDKVLADLLKADER